MSKFTSSVSHFCDGLTVAPGIARPDICPECPDIDFDDDNERHFYEEGGFSSSQCDSCGSTLAGDRFTAHGIAADKEIYHLDICVDCLMFHANGDEPEQWEG